MKENIGYEHVIKLAKVEISRCDLKGHTMKLFHNQTRLYTKKFYFSQRVVGVWGRYPDIPTINTEASRF